MKSIIRSALGQTTKIWPALFLMIGLTWSTSIFSAQLPGLGTSLDSSSSEGDETSAWDVDIYYQNDTRYRGRDKRGERVGLSKFRNTIRVEFGKLLGGGWELGGELRATYDGVYHLNDDQFGNKAGGSIVLQDTALGVLTGGAVTDVPHGAGSIDENTPGLPGNSFGFSSDANPNYGLEVLGSRWHDTEGGVDFGVPVRPCDEDHRGCEDFGGYGDLDLRELASPELNKHADFIRELYIKNTIALENGNRLFVKLGKQQVVWGRTDLFRVLDVVNPLDFSRNNIYDELEEIRIPLWMINLEYRMGATKSMQDQNIQFIMTFDDFRANNLGQCGTANVALDAGCFFRGMVNIWDNGGTVTNFADINAAFGLPGDGNAAFSTDFGPGQIGIRDVHLPDYGPNSWTYGLKYEGVTPGGLSFSVNALTNRSQFPSLRGFASGAQNPFTGATDGINTFFGDVPVSHLVAFDMYFPRIFLLGGSLDFQVVPWNTAVRFEAAVTKGEEFANTARPKLYSENKVLRTVLGLDRPTNIPFLSSPNRTTLISGQLFYQHIFAHEEYQGTFGKVGMPDWKDNFIATLLIQAYYKNDQIIPQIISAFDYKSRSLVVSPSAKWIKGNLTLSVGANLKKAFDTGRWKYDDCRSCNPYAPFTAYNAIEHTTGPSSAGLGGFEPLGRFRAGPIGAAHKENEVFMTLEYKF